MNQHIIKYEKSVQSKSKDHYYKKKKKKTKVIFEAFLVDVNKSVQVPGHMATKPVYFAFAQGHLKTLLSLLLGSFTIDTKMLPFS